MLPTPVEMTAVAVVPVKVCDTVVASQAGS